MPTSGQAGAATASASAVGASVTAVAAAHAGASATTDGLAKATAHGVGSSGTIQAVADSHLTGGLVTAVSTDVNDAPGSRFAINALIGDPPPLSNDVADMGGHASLLTGTPEVAEFGSPSYDSWAGSEDYALIHGGASQDFVGSHASAYSGGGSPLGTLGASTHFPTATAGHGWVAT